MILKMKKLRSGLVNRFVRRRRKEKVARRETSGFKAMIYRALKERKDISARVSNAESIVLPFPDVSRLATFLMPLRGQEFFKQLLRPTRVKRFVVVFLTTLSFVFAS